jgi:3-hydroxyisobutyrate dehydrogenase
MSIKTAISPPASIAVIGLGNMGVPMGTCLLKAGFVVTGFDVSQPARE